MSEGHDNPTEDERFESLLREVAGAPPIPLEAALPLTAGTVVDDQFELGEQLGAGGMGVVYLARDRRLGREVALKVMRLDRWHAARRDALAAVFEREARATARLNHANVVTLHQFGSWDGAFYLVLERLHGTTLAARMAAGPIPLGQALEVIEQMLRGLSHAHALGIIHRDLKPQNVFLTAEGGVKILDFGLAGLAHAGEPDDHLTARAGTPAYMAPEQQRGAPQDARTDVWAAGVMTYQLVTGALPGPRRLEPRALDALIRRALADDPARRPADAGELLAALREIRGGLARAARRRRVLRLAGGLGAAAAIGALALHLAPGGDPDLAGTWAYAPDGRAGVTIAHLGPRRFAFDYTDAAPGEPPSPDRFHIHGELALSERDGERILIGEMVDLPGWGPGQVGEMEFRVLDDDRLMMTRSRWGKQRDHYTFAYPPWLLVRVSR
jgi:hypothetical protein